MPLSDPDFVVQYATGTVYNASDTDTPFFVNFPTAVQRGNCVIIFIASNPSVSSAFTGFYGTWALQAVSSGGPLSANGCLIQTYSRIAVTQTNSFEFYLAGGDAFANARHGAWLAVEVQGVAPDWQGAVPFSNDACGAKFTFTGQSQNNDQTGATTVFNTGVASNTDYGPMLFIAPFVCCVTSGTPPTVTGFANNGVQPGAWQTLGATVATPDAGNKIRLDVAYKIVDSYGPFSCEATYSAAPTNMAACAGGIFGDTLPAQQVKGRAATNSTM